MHYDSKYDSKKRAEDVDLFDRPTRIQSPPAAQVSLSAPTNLSGYDPVGIQRRSHHAWKGGYEWWSPR